MNIKPATGANNFRENSLSKYRAIIIPSIAMARIGGTNNIARNPTILFIL